MTTTTNARGIVALVGAAASFVSCDTCMKLAMADLPPFEVLALRGAAASAWCLPLLLWLGLGNSLAFVFNRWVLLRAGSECLAVLLFVLLLKRMPIGDLTALMQTAPLVILLAGAVIWRDHIGAAGFLLIIIGFAGAVMVAQPGAGTASPVAPLALVAATLGAGRDILSRKVPAAVPSLVAVFATILVVFVAGIVCGAGFESWIAPKPLHLGLMTACGLFLLGGHYFVLQAFRLAAAAVVAPFLYTFTFWAMLSGYVVFGDRPNLLGLAGVLLIVASGVAVVMLDRRRRSSEVAAPVVA